MENRFKINGFHCSACVKLATMKIQKIEGVQKVEIDQEGNSLVESDKEVMDVIEKVVSELGYSLKNN